MRCKLRVVIEELTDEEIENDHQKGFVRVTIYQQHDDRELDTALGKNINHALVIAASMIKQFA